MTHRKDSRHAFTLIELLIVIALIAILSVVVILTLNPAQLLMQSRDGDRLSDMSTLNSALGDYTADQGGTGSFSMGSSSVTYISIPDPTATTTAGSDCTGIGFPTGGSFHCAASSTYRQVNGTGWIPVNFTKMSGGAPISQLPIDPTNQSSTNLYYTYQTDGTTFKLRAVPESQSYLAQAATNPNVFTSGNNLALGGGTGWVLVPGNSQFGTSNFWVMKYDAVCSNGEGVYINDNNTTYNTYSNIGETCNAANNRQIASLPSGWPIANIFQTTAASYCNSIGANLITNAQWQTIAWNAENVASNWSGGTVGSGYVFSGHNDNQPATALVADPNDGNGYSGETNTGGTQKRTLTLSNGSVLWDMAGNIWQWTNDTITGTNEPYASAGGFALSEFTAITTWGTMSQALAGPANLGWSSMQGIGEIYSEGQTDATTYGLVRGGDWFAYALAGVEAVGLDYTPGYTYYSYVGFRCSR